MSLEFDLISSDKYCNYITDGTHGTHSNQESGKYLLSAKDILDGTVNIKENSRIISDEDFNKIHKNYKLENHDVLLTVAGTIGRTAIIKNYENNYTFQRSVAIFKTNDKNKSLWLYYYLNSPMGKQIIKSLAKGTTQLILPLKDLRSLKIPVPRNIDNQKRILSILVNIDKKIEINKKINKNLQNLIKTLYKNYFENFELDNIPNDWEIVNLESIINVHNGYSYKGKELQESDCAMVTIKNFNRDGSFRTDGFKEIIYSDKVKPHHFINENDVLIACTDMTQDADIIGNCVILLDKQDYNELIMSMDLVKIESKVPEINNFLLSTIFKSYSFKKHILGYVNGTTVLHLDKNGIKKFKIALPKNLSELQNISEIFEIIYNKIQFNQKEINKLINLRDTLLPKLMSGEIDVSKIKI